MLEAHTMELPNGVNLEQMSTVVHDDGSATLELLICVANVTYEKEVFCRITFDDWESYTDCYATYQHSSLDNDLDYFACDIPCTLSQLQRTEFAISCSQSGTTHWDNNNWENHRVSLVQPKLQEEEDEEKEEENVTEETDVVQDVTQEENILPENEEVVESVQVQSEDLCQELKVDEEESAPQQNEDDVQHENTDGNLEKGKTKEDEATSDKHSAGSQISIENVPPKKKKSKAARFFNSLNCATGK